MRVLVLVTALLLSGCSSPTDSPTSQEPPVPVALSLHAAEESGFVLLQVQRAAGIELTGVWEGTWDLDDLNPQQLLFISDSDVSWIWGSTFYDNAPWLTGDGAAYAGAGDVGLHTPAVNQNEDQASVRPLPTFSTPESAGLLLFAWGNQHTPLAVHLEFPHGTVIERLHNGASAPLELKDLRGGARLGTPAVALSVADGVDLPAAGGQVVVLGHLYRSDAAAGEFTVRRGDDVQRISLRGDAAGINPLCCYSEDTLFFTSDQDVRIDAWIGGSARSSKVLLLAMHIDEVVLPGMFLRESLER